ncbi:helix-hairpin-helix domain-containing protein [Leptolinea tardivitalis]|uniref:helix-hairpin-helix domain-containing protein n=1 Tax=Leptolinea tardivitalis TaxID=229920 RepID=UPI0007841205|nr:helix-hairpin-helix domain-containing protein [Leptolinea tardivitalis]GAP22951.1 competence protein ComEA helix-hairpin-helix repeat region [Leptolinea tardivitalis]
MNLPELKPWQHILLGVLLGAAAISAALVITLPDRMSPLNILPTTTIEPFQVYVVGAVSKPGVYILPQESRVQSAIDAAGGLLDDANAEKLNLAAPISDGQKIYVPHINETSSKEELSKSGTSIDEVSVIPINSATLKDLENLPGIGEGKAKAILAFREQKGRFQSIDELLEVSGISKNLLDQIRPFLYID